MAAKLNWNDIAYFSDGKITAAAGERLTITTNPRYSPEDFFREVMEAAAKAQLTLNPTRVIAEEVQGYDMSEAINSTYNEETDSYFKTRTYTFSTQVIVPKPEEEVQ